MTGAGSSSAARGVGYDVTVDWDRRLARELPFIERIFRETGEVRRIIDVGSGTGRHAIALVERGFEVTGVDPGVEMLERAHANAVAAGVDVRFVEAGFGQLADLGLGEVDAVMCTGNALPHVDGIAGLEAALRDFAAVIRPGGVLILHLLNHERLLAVRPRSLPLVLRESGGDTVAFFRLFDYDPSDAPERIWLEFVTTVKSASEARAGAGDLGWSVTANRSAHTVMPPSVLCEALERTGFGGFRVYGDHGGKEFESQADESVIVTARRERRGARV